MRKFLTFLLLISVMPISNAAHAEGPMPLPAIPNGLTAMLDPTKQTVGEKIEFTEDQIAALPPEMRAAAQAALDAAKAAAPTTQEQKPEIPSQISGLTADLLSKLTPEQKKMLEEAKKTGSIPSSLAGVLENINDIPPEIYAKLTPDQKAVIEKAKAAGLFTKQMLTDLISKADPKVISALASGGAITADMIKKLQNIVSISCTNGKKTIKLTTKSCPKGYKKK